MNSSIAYCGPRGHGRASASRRDDPTPVLAMPRIARPSVACAFARFGAVLAGTVSGGVPLEPGAKELDRDYINREPRGTATSSPRRPAGKSSRSAKATRGIWSNVEVVTVSDNVSRVEQLRRSCPFPIRHLQAQQPWRLSQKYVQLLRYLESFGAGSGGTGENERLIIYVDAYDVLCLGCRRTLIRNTSTAGSVWASGKESDAPSPLLSIEEVFRGFGKPLFFSAEFGFFPWGPAYLPYIPTYPDPDLPECVGRSTESVPCRPRLRSGLVDRISAHTVPAFWRQRHAQNSSTYRFLNSGCFGGTPAALQHFLVTVLTDITYWRSTVDPSLSMPDPELWQKEGCAPGRAGRPESLSLMSDMVEDQHPAQLYYLRNQEAVALDFGANICLSLYGLSPRHFSLDIGTGEIHSTLFRKPVCFAHANGGGSHLFLLQDLAASRERLHDPSGAWSTLAAVDRTSGRIAGRRFEHQKMVGAYVDTAQCFELTGVLDVASFESLRNTFGTLRFQVWRPVLAKQRSRFSAPRWFFRLVADTGPMSSSGRCVMRRAIEERRGFEAKGRISELKPLAWEVDLLRFNLHFERGDCFGWTVGRDGVFSPAGHGPRPRGIAPMLVSDPGAAPGLGDTFAFRKVASRRQYGVHVHFRPLAQPPRVGPLLVPSVSTPLHSALNYLRGRTRSHVRRPQVPANVWLNVCREHGFRPRRVLHIGASEGVWALQALNVFPRTELVLVDADAHLQDRLANTGATVIVRLLGDRPRPSVAFVSAYSDGRHNAPIRNGERSLGVAPAGALELFIPMATLDGFQTQDGKGFDLVKIDVPGSDLLGVLRGGSRSLRLAQLVILAISLAPLTVSVYAIAKMMYNFGFHLVDVADVRDSSLQGSGRGRLVRIDVLFVSNRSHLLAADISL